MSRQIKPFLDKQNPFHMLIVGRSGRQKTRMTKNLIKHLYKQGYKILIFEPKEFEMSNSNRQSDGYRFAKEEKRERLPVVSYVPGSLRSHVEHVGSHYLHRINYYSMDISLFDNR